MHLGSVLLIECSQQHHGHINLLCSSPHHLSAMSLCTVKDKSNDDDDYDDVSRQHLARIQRQYARYIQDGGDGNTVLVDRGRRLGYDPDFLASCGCFSPSDNESSRLSALFRASCGPGCPLRLPGRPLEGETVVDLGCGAGHDVILARCLVGANGRVWGVDATPEMLAAAKANVDQYLPADSNTNNNCSSSNIRFREGRLDDPEGVGKHLGTNGADVVISNGVFNLCDDKRRAFETAYALLKPGGGRFLLSDLCRVTPNPVAQVVQDCAVCSS